MDKFCRFCLASKSEIQTTEQEGKFNLRTPELHDSNLEQLKSNEKLTDGTGVFCEAVFCESTCLIFIQ